MTNLERKIKSSAKITLIIVSVVLFCCFTTACWHTEKNEIENKLKIDSAKEAHINETEAGDKTFETKDIDDIVLSYAINENPWVMSIKTTRLEDGDECVTYRLNNSTVVELRKTDSSLLGLQYNERFSNCIISFSENEAEGIAKEIVEKYIDMTEFNVTTVHIGETACRVDGILKKHNERFYNFYIYFNAEKELEILNTYPIGVEGLDETITIEQACEYAVEFLKSQGYDFVNADFVTFVDVEKAPSSISNVYNVEILYNPKEPTVENYPFTTEMYVNIFSGEIDGIMNFSPDYEKIDMLSVEKAIEIARDRILITYNLEGDKLITTEVRIDANKTVWYHISFNYDDKESKYYVSLLAETGEIEARGRYVEEYEGYVNAEQQQKWINTAYDYLIEQYPHINDNFLYLRDCYVLSYDYNIKSYVVKYHYKMDKATTDKYDFEAIIIMDVITGELIELKETPFDK